jgi:aldehyde:ferredoxin oxidoreductase
MKSLDGQTPPRITETPYILKKHEDISPDVLKRKSIGSQSNCPACHTTAKEGIYREKFVVIPE